MISLLVYVPKASFRKSHAKTYSETYRYPPPSTVYGMLLSLVGEYDRYRHLGVKIATGLRSEPTLVKKFGKLSRVGLRQDPYEPDKKEYPDIILEDGTAIRPLKPQIIETVEVLYDLKLSIGVDSSDEDGDDTLERRITSALEDPASQPRHGILCLGLSDDMVDDVRLDHRGLPARWLVRSDSGRTELPVWVHHNGSRDTRWRRFAIQNAAAPQPPAAAWVGIQSPDKL